MVSIIAFFESQAGLLVGHILRSGQFPHLIFQTSMYLFLRDTTYLHVTIVHRYVHEVIQIAKHAYLSKLRHPRQQGETDGSIHRLQHAVKRLQHVPQLILHILIVQVLQ